MFMFALSIAIVLANVIAFGLFFYFIFCYKGDGFKVLMYICIICLIVAVVVAHYIFKS